MKVGKMTATLAQLQRSQQL